MTTIRMVMTQPAQSLGSGATVAEAIAFLTQHHVGGAPVVGADGGLVGMISELSLVDVVFDPAIKEQSIDRYMTVNVHTVSPDESLERAAQLFALYGFRRVPAVKDGQLVGMITRRDLMNYALRTNSALTDPLAGLIAGMRTMRECHDHDAAQALSFAGLPD